MHKQPTMEGTDAGRRPFAEAWRAHREAGWEPLPLPVLRKYPPPRGTTGAAGRPLGLAALERVASSSRPWNIGVRCPLDVVGIDVDAYGAKAGELSLRTLEATLGRLPLTVVTTRRFPADETSGIRWYRIPSGVTSDNWPGVLGQGIELIRYGHRYGTAPGSRVHWDDHTQTGPILTYLAVDMRTGETSLEMPRVDSLPFLPKEWVNHLIRQKAEPWAPTGDIPAEWLTDGECARVNELMTHFAPASLNGSRHDAMIATVAGIARLGAMGHYGTIMAIEYVRHAFLSAVAGEPRRDAEAEFRRALDRLPELLAGSRRESCQGAACGVIRDMSEELGEEAPEADAPEPDRHTLAVLHEAERMRVREEAKEIIRLENVAEWEAAPVLTATDLLAEEYAPGQDLIDGLIPENGVILLTAERKSGKTTLLLNVAKSLVDNVPFLGKRCRELERNVMLMDLEMTPATLQMWVKRMGIENLDRLRIMPARGRMAATFGILAGDYSQLADYVRSQDAEVLIIDPLAPLFAVLGWEENDNSDVRKALTILTDFAQAAGVRELILSHHTGWGNGERARGAASFEDAPDNLWRLQRNEADGMRTFSTLGRMEDLSKHIVELNPDTGLVRLGESLAGYVAGTKLDELGTNLRERLQAADGAELSLAKLVPSRNDDQRQRAIKILEAWSAPEIAWVAIRTAYLSGPDRAPSRFYRWTGGASQL